MINILYLIRPEKCISIIIKTKTCPKLDIFKTALKTNWSIVNTFLDNKTIPIIQPVLFNGEIISDFQKKQSMIILLFNDLFASQYTSI